MTTINNNNNINKCLKAYVNVSAILYSEVAPLSGDVISPSYRDVEKYY